MPYIYFRDTTLGASLTLLEDEAVLRAEANDLGAQLTMLLATGRLPVMRRLTLALPVLASSAGLAVEQVDHLLSTLAVRNLAAYRPFARGNRYAPGPRFLMPLEATQLDAAATQRRYTKLSRMVDYATNRTLCRRKILLEYLGERDVPEHCSSCDICEPGMSLPWSHERMADVPNPSTLFDPERVALSLIEANIARAEEEKRAPHSRATLRCVLLGNAYPILMREQSPYMRTWKDRRLRSFPEWGLLASLSNPGQTIEKVFDLLIKKNQVEEVTGGREGEFTYTFLRLTDAGQRAVVGL